MRPTIAGILRLLALAGLGLVPGPARAQTMSFDRFYDWYYYNRTGQGALSRNDLDLAAKYFRHAIEIARPAVKVDPVPLARSYTDLASVLVRQGRADEAEPLAQWALSVREKRFGKASTQTAQNLHVLAQIATAQQRYPKAEELLVRTLAIWEKRPETTDAERAVYLNDLATVYLYQRKYAQAEPIFQRVLAMPAVNFPSNHPDRAISLIGLASLTSAQGEYDRAGSFDRQLITLLNKMSATYYPNIAGSLEPYLAQLRSLGRTAEADTLEAQARITREGKNSPDPEPETRPRRARAT